MSLGTAPAHAGIFDLWEDVKCIADIDCTVQAASTAAGNYITHVLIDKDFEEITVSDVNKMVRGEWDRGFASAVGKVGGLAYNLPPIHLGDYVKTELADNLLNTQAQAAPVTGTGALEPIQGFWSGMRNIAYGLFTIVMVVIGFMIILQKEISPRVVITFTNALPKIALGLILITFSFPIIALIIDVAGIFATQLVLGFTGEIFGGVGQQLEAVGVAAAFSTVPVILIGLIIGGLPGLGITALPSLILFLALALAVVVLMVLVIIRIIVSYTYILVYTIFAPLLLLLGTLPGQEGAIQEFFKKILAKVLVFPATLFFVLLGLNFATTAIVGTVGSFFSDNFGEIITGALTTGLLGVVLALVMLAAAFKAPDLVENALGVGKVGGRKK